ncbi:MAG: hypothetical protein M3Z01_00145 [Thermoproteota archaeon]|nr:hypothetical protein [Thermoproteota archaeon]
MLVNSKQKNIFFIDFDTVFSSYIHTKIFKYDVNNFPDFKIVLPRIENIDLIFKEAINSLSNNSILILDSLNGLIDCLNMLNFLKLKNKNKVADKKSSKYKFAGYQSLNILYLLLKKIENKNIPIVVTVYHSVEKSKKMISELLSNKDFKTNHFIRIANLVIFLEFNEIDSKTGFTIMKKNYQPIPFSYESGKKHKVFYPYSKWYYYNFVNL